MAAVDEKGFDWGLAVRSKAERVLKLLEKGPLLKQERDEARKLTRGIQGFGSVFANFVEAGVLRDSTVGAFDRCCTEPIDQDRSQVESVNCSSSEAQIALKENVHPVQDKVVGEEWGCNGESKPFLEDRTNDARVGLPGEEEHHPFNHSERQTTKSLLTV